MRGILWAVIIAGVLWCGYWFAGTWAIKRGVDQAIAQANTDGMVVSSDVGLSGFPNRFDLTLTDPDFGNPQRGVRWRAPFAQIFAMTWKPWHIIAVVANDQRVDLPGQTLTITTSDLRASLVAQPASDLPLDRIAMSATGLAIASTANWGTRADVVELHTRPDPALPNGHQFALSAKNISPDLAALATSGLPDTIPKIELTGALGFSAPLDRHAGETQPRVTALRVDSGQIDWGPLSLTAKGQIAPNADGLAEGRIDIAITGWRDAVPLAVAAGAISAEAATTATNLLAALARQGGDENTLNLPLVYQDGRGNLGPIPLGSAPQLN